MSKNAMIEIAADTYIAEFKRLSNEMIYVRRQIKGGHPRIETDVFGDSWIFTVVDFPAGFKVKVGREFVPLKGPGVIYVPPRCVIEWHSEGNDLTFEYIIVTSPLPHDAPRTPLFIPDSLAHATMTLDEMKIFICANSARGRVIQRNVKTPALVVRAAELIFAGACSVDDYQVSSVTRELGISAADLSRQFRKTYGITPATFMKRYQVMQSLLTLLDGKSATEAGMNAGFNDLSAFNRQFRKVNHTSPSKFKWSSAD